MGRSRRRRAPDPPRAPGAWAAPWSGWLVALVLFLIALFHSPLLRGSYVQDDHVAIEENPIVARGDVREIFGTSYWAGASGEDRSLYRPISILSYALERRLTGEPSAMVSRGVNLSLHAAVTLTLLLLVRRLGGSGFTSATTALLFALLPVHVEAVANVVGRAELLAAWFSLLALWALTHSGAWSNRDAGSAGRRRLAAWGAAAALFLALGAKEVAVATPLLMVAVEGLFRPAPNGRDRAWWTDRAAALAPAVLAGLVYVILRVEALEQILSPQRPDPADNPLVALYGAERLATALGLVPRYAGLLLFPLVLSADYSGPVIAIHTTVLGAAPLVGVALLGGCVALGLPRRLRPWDVQFRRPGAAGGRELAAFGAWLLLLPYLVIANLFFPVGTVFAERLLYLPSAGFCLLLGVLVGGFVAGYRRVQLQPLEQRVRGAMLIVALLAASYGMRSWARSLDWRDDETLFTAAIAAQPRSPRAHFIVGKIESDRGRTDRAVELFDRTVELYPDWIAALHEKGVTLARSGRYVEAVSALQRSVELSPQFGRAHRNLAIALRRLGRTEEARRSLRKALVIDPGDGTAWAELGNLELERRRYEQAAAAYRRGIALGRDDLRSRLAVAERGITPDPR